MRRKILFLDPAAQSVQKKIAFKDYESVQAIARSGARTWFHTRENAQIQSRLCVLEHATVRFDCLSLAYDIVTDPSWAVESAQGELWLSLQDNRKPDLSGVLLLKP